MSRFDLKQERESLWASLAEMANQSPFAVTAFSETLQKLYAIDRFWTFPGRGVLLRLSHYLLQKQFTQRNRRIKR